MDVRAARSGATPGGDGLPRTELSDVHFPVSPVGKRDPKPQAGTPGQDRLQHATAPATPPGTAALDTGGRSPYAPGHGPKTPSVWLSFGCSAPRCGQRSALFRGPVLLRTPLRQTGRSRACRPPPPHAVYSHVPDCSASIDRGMPVRAWHDHPASALRRVGKVSPVMAACVLQAPAPGVRTVVEPVRLHDGRQAVAIEHRVLRASTDLTARHGRRAGMASPDHGKTTAATLAASRRRPALRLASAGPADDAPRRHSGASAGVTTPKRGGKARKQKLIKRRVGKTVAC